AVLGGGDSALSEALFLTRFARQVTVVHRRDQLRAQKILQERAFAEPKMDFRWNAVVEAIEGDKVVRQLHLRDVKSGAESILEVAGVFVFVGFRPNTEFLGGLLTLDAAGHIVTNEKMETGVPGLWAVGDVRQDSARQVVTAAADGAIAALSVERYLSRL
ncbi:MAG: FAD-dependent oxidoreductase, partial [Chloroflexota bacterium]|nr:FAD-dependent oxidoreductase [Chloroflexota bacterium]